MRRNGYLLVVLLASAAIFLCPGGTAFGQGWSGPVAIDSGLTGYAAKPQVAVGPNGQAVVGFNEQTMMGPQMSLANFFDGSAWATAARIDLDEGANESWDPQVAMDSSGNALAVFDQRVGSDYRVYFNHWSGSAWGGATDIAPDLSQDVSWPGVAMDGNGNAIAVFRTDDTYDRIRAGYWNGSGWVQRDIISPLVNYNADSPNVAMDKTGNAIAVFRQYGSPTRVYASHWNGSSWSAAETIDFSSWTDNALAPSVAMDGNGNAVAVFFHNDGEDQRACANWWNGSSWSVATTIDAGPGNSALSPRVDLNASGQAVAVFIQWDGSKIRAWANHWDGSSWSVATTIDSGAWTKAEEVAVAIDGFGRAVAAFTEFSETGPFVGPRKMYAAIFDGSAWSPPVRIDRQIDADSSANPQVAMDASGHAIVVFGQEDGSDHRVYANRCVLPARPSSTWNYDYDGDGTSEIAIFRETSGLWAVRGLTRVYFGGTGDLPSPGDYDGDGTTDITVFRDTSGLWAVRAVTRTYFGASSDTPLPRDYDGDGTSEIAVFRGTSGLWAVRGITRVYFGTTGDDPIPADYRGYGVAEIGIFRSTSGLWAARSGDRIYFGGADDLPIPAGYDSSPGVEPGIFRPTSGLWAAWETTRCYFGSDSDQPVPAEYEGTGRDGIGIYRGTSGLWAIRGVTRAYFGSSGDIPVTR